MLDDDLRFEVQSGVESQILVRWPGITITASVNAAPIRIDAVAKWQIGRFVLRDDAFGVVSKVLDSAILELAEILSVPLRSSSNDGKTTVGRGWRYYDGNGWFDC